jgi:signal transduction histidine kinase
VHLRPEQLRQRLDVIRDESQRLSAMIENLLNASRIQAGGVELHREPLSLKPLVRQIAQRLGSVSPIHQIVADLPQELPEVLADHDRVHDVLLNLVENAIKYSPKGGIVRITARHTGTEVVVSVSDQGIGIPEGERTRVFERFSRLDSRLVRQRKGAGLGLFICKAIIEAHGGRIWIEGVPGGGSRVSFSLPRQAPAQLPVLFGPRSMLRRHT